LAGPHVNAETASMTLPAAYGLAAALATVAPSGHRLRRQAPSRHRAIAAASGPSRHRAIAATSGPSRHPVTAATSGPSRPSGHRCGVRARGGNPVTAATSGPVAASGHRCGVRPVAASGHRCGVRPVAAIRSPPATSGHRRSSRTGAANRTALRNHGRDMTWPGAPPHPCRITNPL